MDPISQLFMQARGGLAGGEGFGQYAVQGAQLANQRRGQQLQERQLGLEQQRIGQEEQRIGLANRRMQLDEDQYDFNKQLRPLLLEAQQNERALSYLRLELERNKVQRSLNATAGEGAAGRIMLQVADEGFSPRVISEIQTLNSRDPAALWASEAGKTLMENFNAHVKGQLTLRAMQNALGAGGGGVDVNGIPTDGPYGRGGDGTARVQQTFRNPVTGQTTTITKDPVAEERLALQQQAHAQRVAEFNQRVARTATQLSPELRILLQAELASVDEEVSFGVIEPQEAPARREKIFEAFMQKHKGQAPAVKGAPKGDASDPLGLFK